MSCCEVRTLDLRESRDSVDEEDMGGRAGLLRCKHTPPMAQRKPVMLAHSLIWSCKINFALIYLIQEVIPISRQAQSIIQSNAIRSYLQVVIRRMVGSPSFSSVMELAHARSGLLCSANLALGILHERLCGGVPIHKTLLPCLEHTCCAVLDFTEQCHNLFLEGDPSCDNNSHKKLGGHLPCSCCP